MTKKKGPTEAIFSVPLGPLLLILFYNLCYVGGDRDHDKHYYDLFS